MFSSHQPALNLPSWSTPNHFMALESACLENSFNCISTLAHWVAFWLGAACLEPKIQLHFHFILSLRFTVAGQRHSGSAVSRQWKSNSQGCKRGHNEQSDIRKYARYSAGKTCLLQLQWFPLLFTHINILFSVLSQNLPHRRRRLRQAGARVSQLQPARREILGKYARRMFSCLVSLHWKVRTATA